MFILIVALYICMICSHAVYSEYINLNIIYIPLHITFSCG